ncbi:MAG: VWA domain-containing protein [Lentisphaeraceae bacterium]|nr:VWA domain-containing protein [Lentisphaeraceae bacterium]
MLTLDPLFPFWICCVLFAGLVLFQIKKHADIEYEQKKKLLILRLSAFTLLFVLMLKPSYETTQKTFIKEKFIVLIDHSESMTVSDEAGFITRKKRIGNFRKKYKSSFERLSETYDLEFIRFSEQLSQTDHKGKSTSIGSSLNQVLAQNLTTKVAGILLISDGINNSGESIERVIRLLQERKIPVHTYCIGKSEFDEDITDASLTKINSPKTIQRHNGLKLDLEGELNGIKSGEDVSIEIFLNDNYLKTHKVTKQTNSFETQVDIELNGLEAGYHKITAKILSPSRDLAEQNNSLNTFFEISDRQIQVLVIGTSPSPELKFINRFLNSQTNISSTSKSPYYYHSPEGHAFLNSIKLRDFDVIIFQNPDLELLPKNFLQNCSSRSLKNRQGIVFSGAQSLPNLQDSGLFKDHLPLSLSAQLDLENGAPTLSQKALSHFITQDLSLSLSNWSEYINNSKIDSPAEPLVRVNDKTLIAYNEVNNCRSLWLNTSKLWQLYTNPITQKSYEQLWYKMILYASSRDKAAGEELSLYSNKLNIEQADTLELSIHHEPDQKSQNVNPKVTLESISPDGRNLKQDYMLNELNTLKVKLPMDLAGTHKFKVSNSATSSPTLKVFVRENNLEMKSILANQNLMKKISEFTGAKVINTANPREFFYFMRTHSNTKFSVKTLSKTSLWDNLFFYLLICCLLTTEWILRRKIGLP